MKALTIVTFGCILIWLLITSSHSSAKGKSIHQQNHAFVKVAQCEHDFEDVDFCDKVHISQFKQAIKSKKPDFYSKYIIAVFNLVNGEKRPIEKSLAAIDSSSGVVYTFPFETFKGNVDDNGNEVRKPELFYSLIENKICIVGSTYAYRDVNENSRACYQFVSKKSLNGTNFELITE